MIPNDNRVDPKWTPKDRQVTSQSSEDLYNSGSVLDQKEVPFGQRNGMCNSDSCDDIIRETAFVVSGNFR